MNVSLTPELEKFVSAKVGSGRYNSASEVVREALRLLEYEYDQFVHAGASLSEADKTELRKLNEELSSLSNTFTTKLLDATKDGAYKLVNECSLPLTGRGVVDRVITDLAVIDIESGTLVLRELAPGVSVEAVQALTEPPLHVPAPPTAMA